MIGKWASGLAAATATLLAGCTTSLETRPDVASDTGALRGIPYALPMRQYDIAVTRRLASCNTPLEIKGADGKVISNGDYVLPTLSFALSAAHESALVEGERYLVDYEQLSGGSKITSFTIEYHEGTQLLKGINASADDQTGEIIGKTVGAALAVAGLVFAPGAVALTLPAVMAVPQGETAAPREEPIQNVLAELLNRHGSMGRMDCTPAAAQLIKDRAALGETIKRLSTGSIEQEWKSVANRHKRPSGLPDGDVTLTDLTERLSALQPYAGLQPMPLETSDDIAALLAWQSQVSVSIRAAKAKRAAIDEKLAASSTATWPARHADLEAAQIAALDPAGGATLAKLLAASSKRVIDPKAMASALSANARIAEIRSAFPDFVKLFLDQDNRPLPGLVDPTPLAGCFGPGANANACIATIPAVSASLVPVAGQKGERPASELKKDQGSRRNKALFTAAVPDGSYPTQGLLVRPPVLGELHLCKAGGDQPCKPGDRLNKAEQELIPQLGQLRLLPLTNRGFANNGIEVSLAKDGRLTKFTYANKRAIAAAMAAAAADAGKQIRGFQDDQEKRQKTANDARIAELQYQIDLYDKQKKVVALGVPAAEKTAAEAQAEIDRQETAILKAELTRLLVQQCLDRARANPGSPQPCPA